MTQESTARDEVRAIIEETGIIPAIRVPSAEGALFAAAAIFRGGIRVIELTLTVPGAIGVLSELKNTHPELVVGAGTVLNVDTAQSCLDAGAAFLTSPGLDLEIVDFAVRRSVVVIPGVLTPTEVMIARKSRADFVKVFPCAQVGGPSYIRALRAPFPDVRMIASGGVNQQTAGDFIQAGAIALGIREELLPAEAIQGRDQDWIRELTHRFLTIVKRARNAMANH
jgi:2-dehydro-3-deoxyphosphogluconate aldolase / (4S)-4-hydroxy-2-oxoglutarate aldolase